MPTLKKAIQDLKRFSKHDGIAEILDDLTPFQKREDITDENIERLRKKLGDILFFEPSLNQNPTVTTMDIVEKHHFFRSFFNYGRNKDITASALTVFDAVYNTLIALAEFKPLNDTDPITFDKIKDKNKIFTSTGHQYDINTLIDFHNQRPIGGTDFHASRNNSLILNININQPFSPRDVAHIESFIQKKIKNLGEIESVASVQAKKWILKRVLQTLSTLLLLCAACAWFEKNEQKTKESVTKLVITLLFLLAHSSLPNSKKIEEQPLLDYKPK